MNPNEDEMGYMNPKEGEMGNEHEHEQIEQNTLKNNNTEISDDIDKANFINSYFTSIGENLSQKHSTPDDFDILNHIYSISPTTYSTEISITQITKDLEKVKAKKAPGPDGISSEVLSLIKSSAADGLFTVFSQKLKFENIS